MNEIVPSGPSLANLEDRISDLTEKLNAISFGASKANRRFCFYHEKFGKNAVKCQQPCSWRGRLASRSQRINRSHLSEKLLKGSFTIGRARRHLGIISIFKLPARVLQPSRDLTFLIDSGAAVSVLPHGQFQTDTLNTVFDPPLFAANEQRIELYGKTKLQFRLNGHSKVYSWTFKFWVYKILSLENKIIKHTAQRFDPFLSHHQAGNKHMRNQGNQLQLWLVLRQKQCHTAIRIAAGTNRNSFHTLSR